MGLLLLALRIGTFESGMFYKTTVDNIPRGKLSMLFNNRERFLRYLYCLMIGLPIWFIVGILITQAPEFGKALDAKVTLSAGKGILFSYIGLSIGDFIAGLVAQITKSRRLVVLICQISILLSTLIYLTSYGISERQFMWLSFFMGVSIGYWASFVTIASEQFGTNLRSTVTTTVPNFVRGSLIPSTFLFEFLAAKTGIVTGAIIMILLLTSLAIFALSQLKESFNKDLDYYET